MTAGKMQGYFAISTKFLFNMFNRRNFLQSSLFSSVGLLLGKRSYAMTPVTGHPIVISTWDTGLAANKGAWEILSRNGRAIDAVEAGVDRKSVV